MTDSARWHRISPLSVLFFIFHVVRQVGPQALPGLIVAFAAAGSIGGGSARDWVLPGLAALAAVLLGFGVLSWLRFRFRVEGDRVLVRKGVLHREELDVEFDRIQNITIREPFYMRPFGLAVLALDTAGSAGKEIELAGIPRAVALDIRTELLGEMRRAAPPPGGAEAAPAQAPAQGGRLLVELGRRDVLIYGLTANMMLWLALAMGAFFGTGDVAEQTLDRVFSHPLLLAAVDALRREGGTLLVAFAAAALTLLVFLLLPLISMLGALFRYDGYRLTMEDDTLRRSSGLLNRHDDSLRLHKIQAVVWKQNFIARWLRRVNVMLRQASAGKGADTGQLPGGGKAAFLVPALSPERAAELSAVFLPGFEPCAARFSPVDGGRYVRINLAVVTGLAALPLVPLGLLLNRSFLGLLAVVVLAAWLVLRRVAGRFGWAADGEFGLFRSGFIGETTTVFPLFKVQRVDIRQTPVQHRRGIAHLTVHLASHSLTLPYVRMEDAQRFRDLALYAAEASTRRWY